MTEHLYANKGQDGLPVRSKGIFDISVLDGITRNNPAQRQKLIQMVSSLMLTSLAELAQSHAFWKTGDTAAALRMLHTLRGAVGNLGAKRFAAATINIENAAQKEPDEVSAYFETASIELTDTLAIAEIWLKNAASAEQRVPKL
ncbi:Hpt domain-containing protein [Massilia antarctica]|uniref:Hpt domain-containing protein n=1 Tax=Massilia antarctica TaxID=2765360 RepID=UPI00226F9FE0|nr:Hpt domain-containing protein [Massilia sp. H27-R4]MCY0916333.1 Hpt domain-containing protein [Massilia sp. H27-R4]